ncbi:hypothetical protein ACP70R_038098 [Stipagrostis hirtigluma subsp. patula]
MGSPRGSGDDADSPTPSDTGRGTPMVSGALMAQINRATRGSVDMDPHADVSDLAERYLELCEVHNGVFRSLDALASYLDGFIRELYDLAAAAAATATAATDSSARPTVDHDRGEAAGPTRSRI